MARPRKSARVRRIELRLAEDDLLLVELAQEAQLRGVELTQHIYDLLRNRYLIRHGQSLHELLWIPGAGEASKANDKPSPSSEAPRTAAASAAAEAWSDMLETDE